ncbi:hypothetical protein DQ354_00875 [Arthrobacter sp. AQ5-06]|nr:hypothetical protein DQ354_00875 [Arthrobacter sp. AQ5-06]
MPRAVEKVTMIRSSSVLRDVSAAAATAVLALLVGLSAAAPAQAEEGETPSSNCGLICLDDKRGPKDTPTPSPTQTASAPAIEPPPAPVAPAPAPVPTLAPESSVSPAGQTPSAVPSTTIPSPAPSAVSSTESNWNKPITKSAKPTQAAAGSRNDGLFGGPGLLAIMGGVLLVGVAGLAFAWWSRNRLASH